MSSAVAAPRTTSSNFQNTMQGLVLVCVAGLAYLADPEALEKLISFSIQLNPELRHINGAPPIWDPYKNDLRIMISIPILLQNIATSFVVMAYNFSIYDQHLLVLIPFPVGIWSGALFSNTIVSREKRNEFIQIFNF